MLNGNWTKREPSTAHAPPPTSPLALSLSSAYATLPGDLFFSIIQSTVLPYLDRLGAEEQDTIRQAFDSAMIKERSQPSLHELSQGEADEMEAGLRRRVDEMGRTPESLDPSQALYLIKDLLALSGSSLSPSFARWATNAGAQLTLSSGLSSTSAASRSPFQAILLSELEASIIAIAQARSVEFPSLHSALEVLHGSEGLLDALPDVKLGAPGWQEAERERRRMEVQREELFESFEEALRPEGEDQVKSSGPWSGLEAEVDPKEEDRQMGNRLLAWWEVCKSWPKAQEVQDLVARVRRGEPTLLRKKSVVDVLCSSVRKKRQGYDPEATNLRDGMWVLRHALSGDGKDSGVDIERIGPHF